MCSHICEAGAAFGGVGAVNRYLSYNWLTMTFPMSCCNLKLQFSMPSSLLVRMGSVRLCAFEASWQPWIRHSGEAPSWDEPTLWVSTCTCCFVESGRLLGENCRLWLGGILSLQTAYLRHAHHRIRHLPLQVVPLTAFGSRSWLSPAASPLRSWALFLKVRGSMGPKAIQERERDLAWAQTSHVKYIRTNKRLSIQPGKTMVHGPRSMAKQRKGTKARNTHLAETKKKN